MQNKHRSRRLFLETLESRQLLAVYSDTDVGTMWETWAGNYVPPQEFKSAAPVFLTGTNTGQPLNIAIDYLKANAAAYGLKASDLNHYTVSSQYKDDHNGVTHIYLQQTYNGLPVADAVASIHVSASGQVLTAGINFVPNLPTPPPQFSTPSPYISAHTALGTVASAGGRSVNLGQLEAHPYGGTAQLVYFTGPGLEGFAADHVEASLHYVPKANGGLELAWQFVIRYSDTTHWFEASVGAQFGGRVGQIIRLVDWRADASYNVLPFPTRDPIDANFVFQTEIDPQDPIASPFGWHDINGFVGPEFFDTRGNNVSAQDDLNGDNKLGLPGLPVAPGFNDFNFPFILPAVPASYIEASKINAFYWANLIHDISFHYGFTEVAGNFQQENYSNRGRSDDPVRVDVHDSATLNNASMFTPPDGQPGILNLGLSTAFVPNRDNALDNWTIVHEYTHGISNRLTGGPANADALQLLQSGGMGEGWSDWFGLMLTTDFTTDDKNTPQIVSEWVDGPLGVGIRRFPFSFDMAINPQTLDDFNGGFPNNEVHNAGEIWASALWDMTWLLIERYGFDPDFYNGAGGNNLAIQLVFDGMKLQPANPSFLEARDAIVAADIALTGGANHTEIWTAFARRGFGQGASDGGSAAASVVVESFVVPPPLSGVSGVVREDVNSNGQFDSSDTPLAGWVIYIDSNNNGVLNAGEPNTTSAADGTYSLPLVTQGTTVIREVVQAGFSRILPATGSYTVNATAGSNFTGRNFLNRRAPGEITGIKFNDLNANGQRDQGEPVMEGVMIYVDLNKDGRIGVLEPAGITGANGVYRITNVPPGADLQVREVTRPGLVQTFPAPTTLGGAHLVTVVSSTVTADINFGNTLALDFGDAPASYGTTLANNGPRHGIVFGYGLTLTPTSGIGVVDGENNGQPHPSALGDDLTPPAGPDDENGVIIPALTPGTTTTITVGVRTAGFSNGLLQGWIDFNRDGDFDTSEQVVKDVPLSQGIHNVPITIPANALLGSTFARFRYGLERGIGPLGAALAGEVEDYSLNVLQDAPIAVDDFFPDPAFGDPFIKLNSTDNPLNVLRNDFGTTLDPTPEIVAADFSGPGNTQTTALGGIVRFVGATQPLLYTPPSGQTGADSFTYRVTANTPTGPQNSGFATVTINISPSDPIAIDDFFSLGPAPTALTLDVLTNDLAAQGQVKLIKAGSIVPLTSPNPTTLTINATRTAVVFTAPSAFRGTVRYQYTLEDTEPSTADSVGTITIQVGDTPTTPDPNSHAAIFRTEYLAADMFGNPTGLPTNMINLATSDVFFVRLIVNDPVGTPPGLPQTEGVESAYVDLLVDQMIQAGELPRVAPVILPSGRFDITFTSQYSLARADLADFSTPGVLNEIGATHDSTPPPPPPGGPPLPPQGVGNGEKLVMTVKFRALRNGTVRIQADHADSPQFPILLHDPTPPFPGPIQIADEQVFIQPAGTLTITGGSGEGEFTNLRNFFDVNADESVNTIDILTVVNDLTLNGSRPLSQLEIGLSGVLPTAFLDTNLDAWVNALDILGIVNYMTALGAVKPPTGGSGEGESGDQGEGESMALTAALPADDFTAAAAFVLTGEQEETPLETPPAGDDSEISTLGASNPVEEVVEVTTTAVTPEPAVVERIRSRLGDAVDSEAADELFAKLSGFRDQLKSRRRR